MTEKKVRHKIGSSVNIYFSLHTFIMKEKEYQKRRKDVPAVDVLHELGVESSSTAPCCPSRSLSSGAQPGPPPATTELRLLLGAHQHFLFFLTLATANIAQGRRSEGEREGTDAAALVEERRVRAAVARVLAMCCLHAAESTKSPRLKEQTEDEAVGSERA